jgi:hypothetical protein
MSIPASDIVGVIPNVISSSGSNALLSGLFLTQNPLMPAGKVYSFASAAAVASFFGAASAEAALAPIYFAGYTGRTAVPSAMLFAAFNLTARAAWLQSGNLASLTEAEWQALTGTLTVVIDGYSRTATGLTFTGLTSQSQVASAIATGLNTSLPAEATATACTIAGTTLTVGGTITGSFAVGQTIVGASVTNSPVITGQLTGTVPGGAGAYSLSTTSAAVSTPESMTGDATAVTVTWSSMQSAFIITSGITGLASSAAFATGTLAASLSFTSATGAIVSAGAVADTPASAMNNVVAITQNFCGFMTMWEPITADKLAFFAWSNAQEYNPYEYAGWDTDAQALIQGSTTCFGYLATVAAYNGGCCISGDPNLAYNAGMTLAQLLPTHAAFLLGAIASVNFSQANGRVTFMFKSQAGLTVGVNNLQLKTNLVANGYNFYGTWASKANQWSFFAPGQVPGVWKWIDPFINSIWLCDQFQVADMNLLTQVGSVPYDETGYGLLRASKLDTINAAINFGAIKAGVTLSAAEIAEINMAAGQPVASAISTQGWYLQILDPGPEIRALRGTPIQNFWFTDGGAVQKLTLQSVDVM